MRALIALFIGLLTLSMVTPALAKPKDPPPVPIIECAAVLAELNEIVNSDEAARWKGPDIDAIKNDLATDQLQLLIELHSVWVDDSLSNGKVKQWMSANYDPYWDAAIAFPDVCVLAKEITKSDPPVQPTDGSGQFPLYDRLMEIDDILDGYSTRRSFQKAVGFEDRRVVKKDQ
ncbi:MAG: hypothetical protein ABI743_00900 [bacterium]